MNPASRRFERVVQQILERDRAVIDGFFPDQILCSLRDRIAQLQAEDALRPAAVGAAGQKEVHTEIRSDFIRWWPDAPELPAERDFLGEVEALAS